MTHSVTFDQDALTAAHAHACDWADVGYTDTSRAYWAGMRDALAVLIGATVAPPRVTGPGCDNAAAVMLPGCRPQPL